MNDHMGLRWASGQNYYVFATILPPNSASCQGGATTANYGSRTLMSASSNHSGGVNVGLVDGSVRFVSDTVNSGEAMAGTKPVNSGKSPFGVWGAYGSVDGGESTTL